MKDWTNDGLDTEGLDNEELNNDGLDNDGLDNDGWILPVPVEERWPVSHLSNIT